MIKQYILKLLRSINNRLDIISFDQPLEYLVAKYIHPDFFFLQIGGNDGITHDPLCELIKRRNLKGLIVEPIGSYFKELTAKYSNNQQIALANVAIYHENTKVKMYRVNPEIPNLPEWTKGIASLDNLHHKKSNTSSDHIIAEDVDAITLETLFQDYNIKNIDLLQIDTEGFDYAILKMWDFSMFKPKIISFEHGLSDKIMTNDQFLELMSIFIEHGYKVVMKEYDCIAYY
jgi:FkbM family methyltransferase